MDIAESRFETLLDTYAPALRRLCAAYQTDAADQHDLFQEIALALWEALPRFRGDASERTWLYRIAHNVALTYSGKRRRTESRWAPLEETHVAADAGDPRRVELLQAIQRLEAVEIRLALLHLEGLSAKEIGQVLGISEGNAAVRLTRLRQHLTQILNPKEVL